MLFQHNSLHKGRAAMRSVPVATANALDAFVTLLIIQPYLSVFL